jgi:hypothetical protein
MRNSETTGGPGSRGLKSYEHFPNGRLYLKSGLPKKCDSCARVATRFERSIHGVVNFSGRAVRVRPQKKVCERHYKDYLKTIEPKTRKRKRG